MIHTIEVGPELAWLLKMALVTLLLIGFAAAGSLKRD